MRSTKLPLWTEALLGLDPTLPPPHVFALDERELRYGCFHHSAQGFVYEASHSLAVPEATLGEGPLGAPMHNPQAFSDLVAELVGELAGPIKKATLVLPDSWFRLVFTELAELPRKRQAREEMLRWKLKRLVPFRVEELRISELQVTPFPSQEQPLRLLIGFAIERLIDQIEDAFAAAGVEIGRILNTTLALSASLEHTVEARDLAGLVAVYPEAYTLSFFRRGEPLLYRYKATSEAPASGAAVHRDLRLTDSFLRQHFPETPISRIFLAAPLDQEDQWLQWIGDEVAAHPEPLAFEHFQLSRTQVGPTWLETSPLLGQAAKNETDPTVNLARRPFVNRRPVLRVAILLWILGAALAIHNFRQFTGHRTGTSEYREGLETVGQEIRGERRKLAELDKELAKVSLRRENRHTEFLNQLIAFRTFPWSALFDDLEQVVPIDVKLLSVKPNVKLKAEPKKETRRRRGRPRPASVAARSADDADGPAEQEGSSSDDEDQPLRRGEVRLQLTGVARTEDALVELIEVLYDNPAFRSPFLPGESFGPDGTVRFTLSTVYLTNTRDAAPEPSDAPVEAEALAEGPATAGADSSGLAEGEIAGGTGSGAPGSGSAGSGGAGSTRPAGGGTAAATPGQLSQTAGASPRRTEDVRAPAARAERDMDSGRPAEPRSRLRRRRAAEPPEGATQESATRQDTRQSAARQGTTPGEARPGEARPGIFLPGAVAQDTSGAPAPAASPDSPVAPSPPSSPPPPATPSSPGTRPQPLPPPSGGSSPPPPSGGTGSFPPPPSGGTGSSPPPPSGGSGSPPPPPDEPDLGDDPPASTTPKVRRDARAALERGVPAAAWEAVA